MTRPTDQKTTAIEMILCYAHRVLRGTAVPYYRDHIVKHAHLFALLSQNVGGVTAVSTLTVIYSDSVGSYTDRLHLSAICYFVTNSSNLSVYC